MISRSNHIAWAADAVAVFQRRCGTGDAHAIADLICDLGHLAEERGLLRLNDTGAEEWFLWDNFQQARK